MTAPAAEPGEAAIELRDVDVELDGAPVLRHVTTRLQAGRIAVIGDNGSGKSTFARLLDGLVHATHGHVRVLGLDPARQGTALREQAGFVFGNPDAQIIMPTVREDLAFSLRGARLNRARRQELVTAALHEAGLAQLAGRPAYALSGGQKQLLALAAATIREPRLLIADEPTAALDARNARMIAARLLGQPAGRTVVIVTHDLSLAAQCDTALRFHEGRLIAQGEPGEIIAAYERDLPA